MLTTDADIRYQYITAIWDALDELASEWNAQEEKFFLEHEDLRAELQRKEFMNELFDAGECEWSYANTFTFIMPDWFACDQRTLDILGSPDVVWFGPHISAMIALENADGVALTISTTIIDSDEELGY